MAIRVISLPRDGGYTPVGQTGESMVYAPAFSLCLLCQMVLLSILGSERQRRSGGGSAPARRSHAALCSLSVGHFDHASTFQLQLEEEKKGKEGARNYIYNRPISLPPSLRPSFLRRLSLSLLVFLPTRPHLR